MTVSCSAYVPKYLALSAGRFHICRPFRPRCGFLRSLLLSPWQSALIPIRQFGHFHFLGRGDAHRRRDRSGSCSNALGSRDQNAIGRLLCFFFLRHVMTILTRISKAETLSGLMSGWLGSHCRAG